MVAHIDDDLWSAVHISSGICIAAATISVILRFFARRRTPHGLGKDDYCLFAGYVCLNVLYAVYIGFLEIDVRWGLGRHVIIVIDIEKYAISTSVCISCYVFGMVCIKLSILLLYHRIFPGRNFRNALLVLAAVIFSWTMAAFFASIFSCYPVRSSWDPTVEGYCIDYGMVTLVIGIFNILIDFTMLAYPMPVLWKLQMATRRKILLSMAFVAGSVACMHRLHRPSILRQKSGINLRLNLGQRLWRDPLGPRDVHRHCRLLHHHLPAAHRAHLWHRQQQLWTQRRRQALSRLVPRFCR
ncbi:hypothetical protein B0T17DRAFT_74978 [Bombardia bombarda]|uniref:Rhodopsin domain-containing protein n=1 Tax=Bombardia bombarda TaxID=252184 RepID=A0AA39XME8_9PEZI|nr:hypothetical protein B0T17DRAFT_74978 [Bombardia bombarda]